jgi:hypothetical protein
MGHQRDDAGQLEWVNAWAQSMTANTAVKTAEPVGAEPVKTAKPAIIQEPAIARVAHTLPAGQLMRDIAEIERTRDALAAVPVERFFVRQRTRALTLVPSRTTDTVPIVVGGVMALVMLTVFGAAAAMTKLTR